MGLTKPRAHQLQDIDYKQTARALTDTNITLSGGAPATVDGVSLALHDRVLVTGQSTASENGIYYVTTVGAGSNGTWARSLDANETGELNGGTIIMVTEGTNHGDTQWKLTTDDPITIGTTALNFALNSSAAYGVIAVAGQSSIVADAVGDTLTVVAGTNLALTTNDSTDTLTLTPSLTPALTTATFTNTTTDDTILLTTTEDSSTEAPVITLKRNSASPADADYLGQLKFKGENDADQEVVYAKITGKIQDASDGSEDGIIEFANSKAGSNTITARLRSDSLQLLNGTTLVVAGLTYPTADGTADQILKTNGSGTLSFANASGGGATVSSDTTTNAERLIYVGSTTTGTLSAVTQDSGLTYNPSTGLLTSAGFVGALTGNADTATTATTATTANAVAANSVALGTDTTGNYVATGAVSGVGLSGSSSSEGGTFTVSSNATSANTGSTIVARDGSGNFSAGVITATATAARYADLAEKYTSDVQYPPGTVVVLGGEAEVTRSDGPTSRAIAGIVSTDPAYLMNNDLEGDTVVDVALIGRVPCMVTGIINKGDLLVSSSRPGHSCAWTNATNPPAGSIVGKAIENKTDEDPGVIEVLVGRL